MYIFLFLTIFCGIYASAAVTSPAVSITATPTSFMRVLDREVTVTCQLPYVNGSELRAVISLIVSRAEVNDTDNLFKEIASVTEYDRETVTLRPGAGGPKAKGKVEAGSDAYISLTWTSPNASTAGKYRCEVLGVDKFGHPRNFVAVVSVTEAPVDLTAALNKVKQLYTDNDDLTRYKNLSHTLLQACHGSGLNMRDIHPYKDHNYLLYDPSKVSQAEANAMCQMYNGYLAEINDRGEYQFIQDLLKKKFGTNDKWVTLGATDRVHEGLWTYISSGNPVTFTDWGAGTSNTSKYNCMYMHLQSDNTWHMEDGGCDSATHAVLCEIQA